MKPVVLFFIFLLSTAAVSAQETCSLDRKTAPLLLNFQLGASPEQTRIAAGNRLKIKIKKKGERVFFQNFIKQPAPEPLRGVRALYLRFFDRKLYQIEIFYEPRADLKTLADITGTLAAQLNLPASVWQIANSRAEILCGETSLVADNILNPRVELTDETIRAQLEAARKKH